MLRTAFRSVVATLLAAVPALGQTGTISGRVVTADGGLPIVSAQVRVVGTGAGAITHADGRYSIVVQPGRYTVRALRIGFGADSVRDVVVSAGAVTTVDFQLKASAIALSGVVVVGYGTQEARNLTGSIRTVTDSTFNTGRIVSPQQLIEGKVPGVQVVESNEPGGSVSIRIRGGTSVTSSNEPLYVVDNVPLPTGDNGLQKTGGVSGGRDPLNFLNPEDIASVTVLKDAAATAIYGSRGANGVIVITTKSGAGTSGVTATTSISSSHVAGGPNLLGPADYAAAVAKYAPANVGKLGTAATNWRDLVQRSGFGQDHALAFSGNRQDMNYRLSLGYLDQQGVVDGTDVKRLTSSLAYSDHLLNNRLSLQANVKGARTQDAFTPSGVIGDATAFAPTLPVMAPGGGFYQYPDPLGPNNPLGELALIQDEATTYRGIGNLQGKYSLPFLEGLSVTTDAGFDVANANHTTFSPSTDQGQLENGLGGTFNRSTSTQTNGLFDVYGNYLRGLGWMASSLDLTAGYSYEAQHGDYPTLFAQGLSSDLLGVNGVPTATTERTTVFVDDSKLISFFGRANYSIRDRYLATLSVRRDGSSKFGPEHQWGIFPAAAFAWRISEEPFMKGFSRLSELKLRASWGVNGNQAFPNYRAFSDYVIGGPQAQVQLGNTFITTIRPSAADPGIRWERTASTNVGLDYGFFANRVNGTVDVYSKKTTDLIFTVPVAAGTNLSNYLTTNIGSMQNKGVELGLNVAVLESHDHGLAWDASFNAATNTNKLLQINAVGTGGEQILTGGIAGGVGSNIEVLQPGYAVNSFLVYQQKRDASGKPLYADVNNDGTINEQDLYVDQNGDGIINQSDRRVFHDPAPKWILSHTSLITYGNADFSTTLRAYLGNYVYNNVASNFGHYSALTGSSPTNLDASVLSTGFVNPQYFSDVYVESASFLRMDNLTAGYTLHSLRGVRQARIFGTIQNVFTSTHYSGVDPTAGINGIDNNIYPRSRTFVMGANLVF